MSRDVAAKMESNEFAHILSTKRPEKHLSLRSIATSSSRPAPRFDKLPQSLVKTTSA
jgi:hypothetical protein